VPDGPDGRSRPRIVLLKELEPLVREYDQLRKLVERLGLTDARDTTTDADAKPTTTARRAGAPARAKATRTPAAARHAGRSAGARASAAKARAKRGTASDRDRESSAPRSSGGRSRGRGDARGARASTARRAATARPGQRQQEVVRLVEEHPGITVRELGAQLGVNPTGLYPIVKRLTDQQRLRKDGAQLHALTSAPPSTPEPQASPDGDAPRGPSDAGEAPEAAAS
jgi:hypothetical protein